MKLDNYAFLYCDNLRSVTVNWTTPLSINNSVFAYLSLYKMTLNVPTGTAAAYKNALIWKDFKIVETTLSNIDFAIDNKTYPYPNPAQDQVNFSQEISNLEVFDVVGKKTKTFKPPSNNFDISNLEKGVYFLKGKTEDGKNVS